MIPTSLKDVEKGAVVYQNFHQAVPAGRGACHLPGSVVSHAPALIGCMSPEELFQIDEGPDLSEKADHPVQPLKFVQLADAVQRPAQVRRQPSGIIAGVIHAWP
jgi:hypothetical protein